MPAEGDAGTASTLSSNVRWLGLHARWLGTFTLDCSMARTICVEIMKHESMRDSLHHNCHDGNQHLFKQYPTGFYSSIQNKNKNGQLPRTGRGWERRRRRRRPNSRGAEAAAIGSSRQTYVKRNSKPLYLNSEELGPGSCFQRPCFCATHGSRDTGCTTLCLLTATAVIPADSRCCLYQYLC